jgi:hypothetical protein
MAEAAQVLPMDMSKDAQSQQQQQQQQTENQKSGLDRYESVRARLLKISQGEVAGEASPESPVESKASPKPTHQGDNGDEFRRKLMSISYVDVPLPAQ